LDPRPNDERRSKRTGKETAFNLELGPVSGTGEPGSPMGRRLSDITLRRTNTHRKIIKSRWKAICWRREVGDRNSGKGEARRREGWDEDGLLRRYVVYLLKLLGIMPCALLLN
jgi:hypothetical protein